MIDMEFARRRELDELMLRQATEKLTPGEEAQLSALLNEFPGVDRSRYDASVAAVMLAMLDTVEPMPASCTKRLDVFAQVWKRRT